MTSMKVYRPPQEDLTMCVAEDAANRDVSQALDETLKTIRTFHTTRTFDFHSLDGEMTSFTPLCIRY